MTTNQYKIAALVALGLLWGGILSWEWLTVEEPARVPLLHGDVVVWGGPSRLRFHGVAPIADGWHERLGACRINLTFRKAT